jgi:hypothetical protein
MGACRGARDCGGLWERTVVLVVPNVAESVLIWWFEDVCNDV